MNKHTPGPWKVGDEAEGLWVYQNPNDNVICDVIGRNDPHIITDEDYANADLIAAAPELLDALHALVEHCDRNFYQNIHITAEPEVMKKARAIIAKAKGTS